jgi:hypothetical protein
MGSLGRVHCQTVVSQPRDISVPRRLATRSESSSRPIRIAKSIPSPRRSTITIAERGLHGKCRVLAEIASQHAAQAPCRMVFCASPDFLKRYGTPRDAEDLRRAPRLAFSEAVSAADWTLTDPEGQSHLIDGPIGPFGGTKTEPGTGRATFRLMRAKRRRAITFSGSPRFDRGRRAMKWKRGP